MAAPDSCYAAQMDYFAAGALLVFMIVVLVVLKRRERSGH
jgi:hypothetical protein